MAVHPDELDPVEVPSASKCPYCGGEPDYQSSASHHLSALDYLHDDVMLKCEDCRRKWACGVPIGGPPAESFADLWCDSCDNGFMLVHRVEVSGVDIDEDDNRVGAVGLHLKCPNHERFRCPHEACLDVMEPFFCSDGEPYCSSCRRRLDQSDLDGHGCFHFDTTQRRLGPHGVASTFYPQITGDTERGQPYGAPEP